MGDRWSEAMKGKDKYDKKPSECDHDNKERLSSNPFGEKRYRCKDCGKKITTRSRSR